MALPSISTLFRESLNDSIYDNRYRSRNSIVNDKSAYMIVPIFGDKFEIPTMVLSRFIGVYTTENNTNDYITKNNALCINLYCKGYKSNYASLVSKVKDCMNTSFFEYRLLQITTKENRTYYITNSAIFDDDLKPMLMLSWEFERVVTEEVNIKYKFVRPILRIDPSVYTSKLDELQKFIVNKMISEALLTYGISQPFFVEHQSLLLRNEDNDFSIKVEFDKSPFLIKTTDKPSVSTTNKELLNTAITYVDEMI